MSSAVAKAYAGQSQTEQETLEAIRALKKQYGERLVILGHHYQRHSVVAISDFLGDSFDLARRAAAQKNAEFIVFCGVQFMAESAAVLAQPHQKVIHPNPEAGCPLADFAPLEQVEAAWQHLEQLTDPAQFTPVVYVNSSADLKAFVGEHGGTTCTSSNAARAFEWAFRRTKKLFFFPDKNLGRNTAVALGIPDAEIREWDPELPDGGLTAEEIRQARVLLWKGYCHVHAWFRKFHVERARLRYPTGKIVVHPECAPEVVQASDGNGSTKFIVDYVQKAPAGSTIIIGTELNLVTRLALENPDKTVVPLAQSPCPNMWKITPKNVLEVLENLGNLHVVSVSDSIISGARKALERMMTLA